MQERATEPEIEPGFPESAGQLPQPEQEFPPRYREFRRELKLAAKGVEAEEPVEEFHESGLFLPVIGHKAPPVRGGLEHENPAGTPCKKPLDDLFGLGLDLPPGKVGRGQGGPDGLGAGRGRGCHKGGKAPFQHRRNPFLRLQRLAEPGPVRRGEEPEHLAGKRIGETVRLALRDEPDGLSGQVRGDGEEKGGADRTAGSAGRPLAVKRQHSAKEGNPLRLALMAAAEKKAASAVTTPGSCRT